MPLIKNDRAAFRAVSPRLWFCVILICVGELAFGLDGSAFSSFQVLPSWLRIFGQVNAAGKYTLLAERRAVMTSIQWVGKLFGTFIVEPFVHRYGYRWTLYLAVAFHLLGCTLEIATHDWRVFSSGRVFQYVMIGIVENIGPTYIVESVPSALRAFFVVFIFVAQAMGGVIMLAVFQGIAFWDSPHSWYLPIAVQYLPGFIIAAGVPFFVESPRLLVAKGRKDEAKQALARLRGKAQQNDEILTMEVQAKAMEDAIAVQQAMASKSGWLDLFRGVNLRRTTIAVMVFIFNQWTGQQFITSYGPTFYATYGLGSLAFTYALLGRIFNVVFSLPVAWCYDRFGRRPCILTLVTLATIFLVLVGALGDNTSGNPATVNTVVAGLLLFNVFTAMGWSKACWIMGPEVGSALLRKKTMAFATQIDVLAAFGVTFSFPYMLQAMSNKAVYVYVGVGVFSIFYTIFFVPETRGRSLEELDEIFAARVWAWQFSKFNTTGSGRDIAMADAGHGHESTHDEEMGKEGFADAYDQNKDRVIDHVKHTASNTVQANR